MTRPTITSAPRVGRSAIALALGAALGAQSRTPLPRVASAWLPMQEGASWTYDVRLSGQPPTQRTFTCTNVLLVQDTLVHELRIDGGSFPSFEYWRVDGAGIFRYENRGGSLANRGFTPSGAERVLSFPIGLETAWTWRGMPTCCMPPDLPGALPRYRTEWSTEVIEVSGDCVVPAGRMQVVTVRRRLANAGLAGPIDTVSFAPGIGIVRRTWALRDALGDERPCGEMLLVRHVPPALPQVGAVERVRRALLETPSLLPAGQARLDLLDDLGGISVTTRFVRARVGASVHLLAVRDGTVTPWDPGSTVQLTDLGLAEGLVRPRESIRFNARRILAELGVRLEGARMGLDLRHCQFDRERSSEGDGRIELETRAPIDKKRDCRLRISLDTHGGDRVAAITFERTDEITGFK